MKSNGDSQDLMETFPFELIRRKKRSLQTETWIAVTLVTTAVMLCCSFSANCRKHFRP